LKKKGVSDSEYNFYLNNVNSLPNLQLLEGNQNKHKSATDLKDWYKETFKSSNARANYRQTHLIPEEEDLDFTNFKEVFLNRRELMKQKFTQILNQIS
jgi:hypothetical protein